MCCAMLLREEIPSNAIGTTPRHWHRAVDVGDGFMRLSGEKIDTREIPNGFYQWDLLRVNTETKRNVVTFCKKWGAPFHPMRFDEFCYILETRDDALRAIEITNTQNTLSAMGGHQTPFVYWKESAAAIKDMQSGIRAMLLALLGEDSDSRAYDFLSRAIEHCARYDFALTPRNWPVKEEQYDRFRAALDRFDAEGAGVVTRSTENSTLIEPFGLTSAICNQVADEIASPEPWCICSKCGTPFKRPRIKDSKRQTERTNSKRRTCADNCTGKNDRLHTR